MSALVVGAVAGGASAVVAGVVVYSMLLPRTQLACPTVWRGRGPARRCAALTFDDGPCPGSTDAILAELDAMGVRATFFVIGQFAKREPELVRALSSAGHVVANHSFDHSHYGMFRGGMYWRDQLVRADDAVERAIGRRPRLFRPPMGFRSRYLAAATRETGHTVVTWTRRGLDGISTTPAAIVERVAQSQAGDIIALHDGVEPKSRRDASATVRAVRPACEALLARGIELVTLDKLLGLAAYAGG